MLEDLLKLENCHWVDELPKETLYIHREKFPPIKDTRARYSKEILTTKNGAVMVVRTFHPDWSSPVAEVYLKKSFSDYIERNVNVIIEAYRGDMKNEADWKREII